MAAWKMTSKDLAGSVLGVVTLHYAAIVTSLGSISLITDLPALILSIKGKNSYVLALFPNLPLFSILYEKIRKKNMGRPGNKVSY